MKLTFVDECDIVVPDIVETVSITKSERDSKRAEKACAILRDQLTIERQRHARLVRELQMAKSYSRTKKSLALSESKCRARVEQLNAKLTDASSRLIVE